MSRADFYEVCFVEEIVSKRYPSNPASKLVRVLGKLKNFDPVTSLGELSDPEAKTYSTLAVNFENISDTPLIRGILYQVVGEVADKGSKITLNASIVRNVDGIDMQMYKEAINLRRQFLSK
ncbi:CST complex subunit TEN1-like [Stegodyphus dumicola]|uniref:CST complex subunit TEN1-like n=1 Tax=Stegodyphus dumicola TaxID=202533 RepID=UPI0015AEFDA4|nr:CST complex subunit TEN1-like [Stegodyphus dumicola]